LYFLITNTHHHWCLYFPVQSLFSFMLQRPFVPHIPHYWSGSDQDQLL
jgi:hypothetical protein